jgi:hypothetical protein
MNHGTAAQAAALVGGCGCGILLLLRGRRAFFLGLAVIVVAEALLGWSLVPADDLHRLVASPVRVAALVVGLGLLVALGAGLSRYPTVLPVLALAAAPFRVPIHLGNQDAFLLVPLYVVIAAAAVALALRAVRGDDLVELPRILAWPAAGFVGYSAVSLLWSSDLRAGTIDLLFFLFPFVVLVVALARTPYADWLTRPLAATLVGLALVFTSIGIWQLWSERLFFAKDLEVANAYTSYFRTTSIFADSSLYGLQLAVAIVVLLVAMWLGGLQLWLGLVLVAALWTGLYFSYSQSSMVALAVAALGVSFVAASRGARMALVVGTAALLVVGAVVVTTTVQGDSAQRFTSGRSQLVSGTARVFADHPLVGVGIGAQPKATREAGGKKLTRRNASHTTPLTIAAEGGIIGLALYVAFLLGAAKLLAGVQRVRPVLGLGLAGAFLVLFVHSLLYAGFFQDPLVWGVVGFAAAVLAALPQGEAARGSSAPARVAAAPVPGRWQT